MGQVGSIIHKQRTGVQLMSPFDMRSVCGVDVSSVNKYIGLNQNKSHKRWKKVNCEECLSRRNIKKPKR